MVAKKQPLSQQTKKTNTAIDDVQSFIEGGWKDPTENVKALTAAANVRQDDLRAAHKELVENQITALREVLAIRSEYARDISNLRDMHIKEMRNAEAERLDSIRQVDVTAVRTEATRSLEAIQTLATTSARDAETLRNALVNTAATIASQTADTVKQIVERIAALERSNYEGVGKQRLADPQLAEVVTEVKRLAQTSSEGTGKQQGLSMAAAVLGGLMTIAIALAGLAVALMQ